MFKNQIALPNPDNNHILLFASKLNNRVSGYYGWHMIASGIGTYGFKTYLGEWAEEKIHSRLGASANFLIIFIYFLSKERGHGGKPRDLERKVHL